MQQSLNYLPLIFALKDLRIKYFTDQFNSPKEFARSACLVRGDTILEMAENVAVDAFLKNEPSNPLPDDPMAPLLRRDLSLWPEDTFIAVRGIMAFGPGDITAAKKYALHSLKLNPDCTLAKQLLQLLFEKKDPRVPFSNVKSEVEDTLIRISGERKLADQKDLPPKKGRIFSDSIPGWFHQRKVHRQAMNCLKASAEKLSILEKRFSKDPLLGLEVTDEALVLFKNEPVKWEGNEFNAMTLARLYKQYSDEVDRLRGGRHRRTTTPTMRGGGKRKR